MFRKLLEFALIGIAAVGVAYGLQAFVVKPYRIPTPSMATTLCPGDRVLVERVGCRLHALERGDVIVFESPNGEDVVLVKRVVGLPGEVLSLRNGRLMVDGRALAEPYVHETDGFADVTRAAPPLAGTTMSRPWSLAEPYTVPAGSYFVMGDNRLRSADSRVWGAVRRADIVGQAVLVYWPVSRVGGL